MKTLKSFSELKQLTVVKDRLKNLVELIPHYNKTMKENLLSHEDLIDLHRQDFHDRIRANRRSSKSLSRKSRQRLHMRWFICHVKSNQAYMFYRPVFEKKGVTIQSGVIYYDSTPKGVVYFHPIQNTRYQVMMAVYAHCFDRWSERIYNSELDRARSICSFCSNIDQDKSKVLFKGKLDVHVFTPKGIILGNYTYMTPDGFANHVAEDCGENVAMLMSLNTFIDQSMFTKEQRKNWNHAMASKAAVRIDGTNVEAPAS